MTILNILLSIIATGCGVVVLYCFAKIIGTNGW